MVKKLLLFISFISLAFQIQAQNIDEIYKYYFYGQPEKAAAAVIKLAAEDPTSFDKQFYQYSLLNAAGKYTQAQTVLAFIKNNATSSAYKEVAAELEKINAGTNGADLADNFAKALRRGKKAKGFLSRMIGEQFLFGPKKDAKLAVQYIKSAVDEYEMRDATTRMLLGDAYALKNDAGNAVTNYEYAAELDKTNAVPHYKIGRAYMAGQNYDFAIPSFQQAIKADPKYAVVYRDLGYYYYETNNYPEAKANFQKYLELTNPTINDRLWYANTLFLNKDYADAISKLDEIKRIEPKYKNVNRLLAYSQYENKQYPQALQSMDLFFNDHDTITIVPLDYEYAGKIRMAMGQDSLAYLDWLQAFNLDSNRISLIKEIADTLYARKKYDQAGYYYYEVAKKTNLAVDYYYATMADYQADKYERGDLAAQGIIAKVPDDPTGYLWRARHQVQMDKTGEGKAEPYYMKVIELAAKDPTKYKRDLTEAANWLTGFYISKKDFTKANEWNDKALEFDDSNAQTIDYMEYLSTQKK